MSVGASSTLTMLEEDFKELELEARLGAAKVLVKHYYCFPVYSMVPSRYLIIEHVIERVILLFLVHNVCIFAIKKSKCGG